MSDSLALKRETETAARPEAPRAILIASRVNFDASLHAPLANHMAQEHGTHAVVFVGRREVGEKWRSWTNGAATVINDEDLAVAARRACENWEGTAATARVYEQRYGISYMRDVLHQDKGVAAIYLQHAPGSVFARQKPQPFAFLVALVNEYFKAIEDLLERHPVDLFLTRASGLFNSAAVAVARQREIPVSWLNHTRSGRRMIWMEGAYHASCLIADRMKALDPASAPDAGEIASPPDTASAREAAKQDASLVALARHLAGLTRSRIIMRGFDLLHASWPRRLPYAGNVVQTVSRCHAARFLQRQARADAGRLEKGRYVLFALHLDPEYTSSTLSRHFNHTHALIQQLALSLPVGYTLAIKEHVIGMGNRSVDFYKELAHLPNVAFVDYRLRAIDLAADAAAVATVWGTICLEASLIGVPVICFTRDSEFAMLDNVHTVDTPTEIPDALREALAPRSASAVQHARQQAAQFREAQLALSFELSTIDIDEHGNRNRHSFGVEEHELAEAMERLLAVYRQALEPPARGEG